MKFQDLLVGAIQRSEIPLRFEPGAEDAIAKPVTEVVHAWVAAHMPVGDGEFNAGWRALVLQLLAELEGSASLPD